MSRRHNGAEETETPGSRIRISKEPMDLVRFALDDLEAGYSERDAFSSDEIALQALVHHPRYMKRKRALRRGKAPLGFSGPLITSGLIDLERSGELGHRFEDDERNVIYDPRDPAFTEEDRPRNLGDYNRMYYTIQMVKEDAPINASHNGNGASPDDRVPQALIDDIKHTA